jgi:RNA polymerase sigma-70 factor, ECF subfamily
MGPNEAPDLTELLKAWGNGDAGALNRLTPAVAAELKRIARRSMRRERREHTLQTTALVNEAYLRLVDLKRVNWTDRAHFFAISALIMRRILVEQARERMAEKRGGGAIRVTFAESLMAAARDSDVVAVDEALTALGNVDARKAKVVELRFFGGLSVEEIAYTLGISEQTVHRDWRLARSWLQRELTRRG